NLEQCSRLGGRQNPHVLKLIHECNLSNGTHGDIAEIGVHHGKLIFLMAAPARKAERAFALDLYEDQDNPKTYLRVDQFKGRRPVRVDAPDLQRIPQLTAGRNMSHDMP
ncbi:MAG TPA: hypothetical protein VGC14_09500, partial [Rhizobium sp.]